MIEVKYDGAYPNACRGTLIIIDDGAVIYEKDFRLESMGSVTFDDDWNECVCGGDLVWLDADKYSIEIRKAVEDELAKVSVCCGGCA